MVMSGAMKIGIDFDNTIINYGNTFKKYAMEHFGMPAGIKTEKQSIRTWFWSLPNGNTPWTELQGIVYGEKILEATLFDGLDHFLRRCKDEQIAVSIISHKSEFAALGPKINLRDAAMKWLELNGFFDKSGYALSTTSVFFESTRYFKVMRIGTENCSVFIDDLQDVFEEPSFPATTRKILFSSDHSTINNVTVCPSWKQIEHLVFDIKQGNNQ